MFRGFTDYIYFNKSYMKNYNYPLKENSLIVIRFITKCPIYQKFLDAFIEMLQINNANSAISNLANEFPA